MENNPKIMKTDHQNLVKTRENNRELHMKNISPAVDIFESSKEIIVVADIPGVNKENLSISLENKTLSIEGEMSLNIPEKAHSLFGDITSYRYVRSFSLGQELDEQKTQADFTDGILKIRIPKNESYQARKIEINSNYT